MLEIAPISSGRQKANTDTIDPSVGIPNTGSCSPLNKQANRAKTEASTRTSRRSGAAHGPTSRPCPERLFTQDCRDLLLRQRPDCHLGPFSPTPGIWVASGALPNPPLTQTPVPSELQPGLSPSPSFATGWPVSLGRLPSLHQSHLCSPRGPGTDFTKPLHRNSPHALSWSDQDVSSIGPPERGKGWFPKSGR